MPSKPTPNTVTGPAVKTKATVEKPKPPVEEFPLRPGWEWQDGDPPAKSSAKLKEEGGFDQFSDDLIDCLNLSDLKWVEDKWSAKSRADGWPVKWKHAAGDRIEGRETAILLSMSPDHLADVPLDKALKQSLKQNVLNAG
jgi:hypothetical protein